MPDFSVYSNFNKSANFTSVKIGAQSKVLEVEFNEMQQIQEESRIDILRDSIPSGFVSISDLDYVYMSTSPNQIKLISDSVMYVNGYRITIPAGTIITLNAPPTTGYREDLIFIEVWKEEVDYTKTITSGGQDGGTVIANTIRDGRLGVETSKRIQLRWRFRVVDGVDFATYSADGFNKGTSARALTDYNGSVRGQGGNSLPLDSTDTNGYGLFTNNLQRPAMSSLKNINDVGLYVAGDGNQTSKDLLKTADGYVYAIPMFKVKRRNSSAYGVNNGNGAREQIVLSSNATVSFVGGETKQVTFTTSTTNKLAVGDILYRANSSSIKFQVISVDDVNKATLKCLVVTDTSLTTSSAHSLSLVSSGRPDSLFNNIIVDRDVIDLRHKVSLTGFNYQQLLDENFDKLLRGELQTLDKTKMLKTYHGIPKTPIDANHVFYASFDGTTVAEVGGAPTSGSMNGYKPSSTGLGAVTPSGYVGYPLSLSSTVMTLDFSIIPTGDIMTKNIGAIKYIANVRDSGGNVLFHIGRSNTSDGIGGWVGTPTCSTVCYFTDNITNMFLTSKICHVRCIMNTANNTLSLYVNGTLILTQSIAGSFTLNQIASLYFSNSVGGFVINDVSVSNIDRGANFATLPKDFIDGYARIVPAFNNQRQVFSDALTSQYTCELIKTTASGRVKQFTVTQSVTGQWTAGDTIKVTGIGGEIITGVIDSDTALAKVLVPITTLNVSQVIQLDDVSKISVGDSLNVLIDNANLLNYCYIVDSVDMVNKTITIHFSDNFAHTVNFTNNITLFETTISNSSPIMKANISGIAQAGGASTITLPSTFNPTDGAYNNLDIMITSGTGAGQRRTISAYTGSTKIATVSSAWTTQPDATSQFTIYAVPIAGTWSGLGTNQVTFTLGTLYALNTQDIQIEYSLNMIAGQGGGLPEVLTTTLAGETNGKKLIMNPSVHIRDDFKNKTAGDLTACPNVIKRTSGNGNNPSLLSPSAFVTEFQSDEYSKVITLDGICQTLSTNVNGSMPQFLLQYNVIGEIEDRYGAIPAIDKVAWVKNNISTINSYAYINGSCPSGNKAYFKRWLGTDWSGTSSTGATPTLTTQNVADSAGLANLIQPDGCIYYLIYTDASDGVTASQINIDYPYLDIIMKSPTGYDVLAPENPRRDDGKANMLFIRKETKEIQVFMDAMNTDGIVTYGDYVPYQGIGNITSLILAELKHLLVTTHGTGGASPATSSVYKNITTRVPKSSNTYDYNFDNTALFNDIDNLLDTCIQLMPINYIAKDNYYLFTGKLITTGGTLASSVTINNINTLAIYAYLTVVNNELLLKVRTLLNRKNAYVNAISSTDNFKLNYRPLIK